ncbi:MAG: porin family protein [Beijerinckiaceae bacterium]|nr:porin family protein [Beijerinckiaceae bacterium]
MKKLLLATTAILLAAPAFAADLPRRSAAVAPAPMFVQSMNWTGFYVGLNVGYVAAEELGVAPATVQASGLTLGARVGYDWQVGQSWVIGAFVDLDAGFAKETVFGVEVKTPLLASINLRAGYLIAPSTLLYVTGGYTYADIKLSAPFALPVGLPGSADGYNIGAGIEHRFNNNWSVFGEYRYTALRLNNPLGVFPGPDVRDVDANVFKVGVNYRFGGASRPVVARY